MHAAFPVSHCIITPTILLDTWAAVDGLLNPNSSTPSIINQPLKDTGRLYQSNWIGIDTHPRDCPVIYARASLFLPIFIIRTSAPNRPKFETFNNHPILVIRYPDEKVQRSNVPDIHPGNAFVVTRFLNRHIQIIIRCTNAPGCVYLSTSNARLRLRLEPLSILLLN